ncbi:hypothetical protein TorRG33x02_292070 [Trema orientale]|uniref:Transmembrane protein n=1 Tax=Trema orientale TaxID=63057 RepID=A0A2P5CAK9_TREOI|nr:hypothetical protein TorRG33x02_292070 [Trema orientale]
MARGPSFLSISIIVFSLLLSFIVPSPIESRPVKKSRSHNDFYMVKEIEGLVSMNKKSTATSAPGPSAQRHRFELVQTIKWAKNSGPSPGQGHKNGPEAGSKK